MVDHTIKTIELAQELDCLMKKAASLYTSGDNRNDPETRKRIRGLLNEVEEKITELENTLPEIRSDQIHIAEQIR